MVIEVPSIKVNVPIPSALLPRNILPPVGQPGSSKATVVLKLSSGGLELRAEVKAKSYRDVLAKVDSSPHGAYVVLQGKLKGQTDIIEAGFSVQPIVPKDSASAPSAVPPKPPSPVAEVGPKPKPRPYVPLRSIHY